MSILWIVPLGSHLYVWGFEDCTTSRFWSCHRWNHLSLLVCPVHNQTRSASFVSDLLDGHCPRWQWCCSLLWLLKKANRSVYQKSTQGHTHTDLQLEREISLKKLLEEFWRISASERINDRFSWNWCFFCKRSNCAIWLVSSTVAIDRVRNSWQNSSTSWSKVTQLLSNTTTPFWMQFFNSIKDARFAVDTYGLDHRVPFSSTFSSYLTHLKRQWFQHYNVCSNS